jgi:hypothetical protein
MSRTFPLATLLLAASLLAPPVAMAADAAKKGSNADAAKATASSPATQAVEAIATAHALARYGDARKDPLALITAAKLKKEAGGQDATFERTGKSQPGEAKGKADTMSVEALIERAKALSAGRADLVALADDVLKGSARGAAGGPRSTRTVVRGGGTDQFRITFIGGEPAAVGISGDGDSRLDLYVYDENGNAVCNRVGPGDDAICRFNPRWTGPFIVRVVNRGVANEYRLLTN